MSDFRITPGNSELPRSVGINGISRSNNKDLDKSQGYKNSVMTFVDQFTSTGVDLRKELEEAIKKNAPPKKIAEYITAIFFNKIEKTPHEDMLRSV